VTPTPTPLPPTFEATVPAPVTGTPESTLRVFPTRWPTPKIVTTLLPDASVSTPWADHGQLYFEGQRILDLTEDKYFCSGSTEVSYSPTGEYFLVILYCHEGLNKAFLFRIENGRGREITGSWETVLGSSYSWSPNGQSLVYYRVTNCCTDAIPELPSGLVLYNIPTGSRLFLTPFPAPRQWSPDGQWLAYTMDCKIYLANSDGYGLWYIDDLAECNDQQVVSIHWEITDDTQSDLLIISSDLSIDTQSYVISSLSGSLPTEQAIPVDMNSVINP
jgi:dipeptidyl aminopeptidase/acylaminoacyl peptidase